MLKLTNPRLGRFDIVVNSFYSGISNTPKEFSRTPEAPFSEIVFQPRMFLHQHPRGESFKQLQSFADTHCRRKFNKQMHMINSNVQFIDFASLSVSNLPQKEFTIHPEPVKFEWIFSIFNFPHKVESILSEAMLPRFQIHFSSPEHSSNYVHQFISGGLESRPSDSNQLTELNFEDGDSSPNLKVWVSSPWM
jgi:hypothetical protein